MILKTTINIPEFYFGMPYSDVQIKLTNESTDFIPCDIANAQLIINNSHLGEEFPIVLDDLEENNLEELVVQGITEMINSNID